MYWCTADEITEYIDLDLKGKFPYAIFVYYTQFVFGLRDNKAPLYLVYATFHRSNTLLQVCFWVMIPVTRSVHGRLLSTKDVPIK